MTWHKTIFGITFIIILAGCANKHAPVVSRPDNLIIDCPTGCKFNIPMNTEIIVARNTNGYDMMIAGFKQIPIIGSFFLSWKSMDMAESVANKAIDSFSRGQAAAAPPSVQNNDNRDYSDRSVDSSGSGNSNSSGSGNSADIATTTGPSNSGNTTGPADSGNTTITGGEGDLLVGTGDINKPQTTNTTTYSNAFNDAGSCNGTGCTPAAPIPPGP